MSLDNILKKIKAEALAEAGTLLAEAETKTAQINEAGKGKFDKLKEASKNEEAVVTNELKNAYLLPAKLAAKAAHLETKQALISRVFEEALTLEGDEYKKVLEYFYKQIADVKSGTVYPAEGKEDVTKAFLREKGFSVEFGASLQGMLGGFVLKSGKVEYDCSFKTLLKQLREKLEPQVAAII